MASTLFHWDISPIPDLSGVGRGRTARAKRSRVTDRPVMQKPDVDSAAWWAERGVAEEVRAARGYVRWTTKDLDPVREAYAGLSTGQLRTVLRWAGQSDGLVIHRHAFKGASADGPVPVYPEIRPDHPILTETVWHYHGQSQDEPPRHPNTGKPLREQAVRAPESQPGHIARDREPDDHRGVNTNEVHAHRHMAKYLFPPSANGLVIWMHSHQHEYEKRVLRSVVTEPGSLMVAATDPSMLRSRGKPRNGY
jgi:hypothetical protein